jgi:iron(III) transport system substrate-binding protein
MAIRHAPVGFPASTVAWGRDSVKQNENHSDREETMRILAFAALFVAMAAPSAAENLTAATKKMLADAKLPESVMSGLDKELAVPAAMVAAAKKEGKARIQLQMSEQEFVASTKLFHARYPGIELEYIRGIGAQTQKVLVAYRTGTVIADVIAAYDSRLDEFRAAGLMKMSELPSYASLREEMKTPEGLDGADKLNYWCMTYSAERVRKDDLPKTWDQVVSDPKWRGGKLAVASNTGQTLLPTLAVRLGESWTNDWLDKLFKEARPQLRKETLAATSKLVSVGEFDLVFAVQDYVTERDAKRGMPVAPRCPEPLVGTWGKLGILSASPYPNAARLYANWHMSKEGQIAHYVYGRQVPVHGALGGREFLPYPDEVLGKKILYRTDDVLREQPKVMAKWRQAWESAGGAAIQ